MVKMTIFVPLNSDSPTSHIFLFFSTKIAAESYQIVTDDLIREP